MGLAFILVTSSIKYLTRLLCIVDDAELINVPIKGPLIIVSNHVNFIEVPILFTHMQPRKVTGFAKSETWDNPALGYLFNLWGAIPIRRGEAGSVAMKSALGALKQGKILAIAPEGTRSGHGKLQKGHSGIIMLAQKSGAPILPLAFFGAEMIRENINQLRRTNFHIRVGKPFRLVFPDGKLERDVRDGMVDEIMYHIALLLPPEYRGYYSVLPESRPNYIHYL
jgi:1-acyl-sn-glycerol-3-phosphate acyltransferase